MDAGLGALLVLLAGGTAGQGLLMARAARDRRAARAGCLRDCLPLFDRPVAAVTPSGFPRLSGRRAGALWDVQLVPDTLSMRKLPALWLMVSRIEARGGPCLDILRRPAGTEPFTAFASLPVSIAPPEGLPADCAIRAAAAPATLPPAAPLSGALDDPRVKELRLASSGIRMVWLAEEGDRSRYLLFREAELGLAPLPPAVLLGVMDRIAALHDALGAPALAAAA